LVAIVIRNRAIFRGVDATSYSVARRNKAPVAGSRANERSVQATVIGVAAEVHQTNIRRGASSIGMVASSRYRNGRSIGSITKIICANIIVVAQVRLVRVIALEAGRVSTIERINSARIIVVTVLQRRSLAGTRRGVALQGVASSGGTWDRSSLAFSSSVWISHARVQ